MGSKVDPFVQKIVLTVLAVVVVAVGHRYFADIGEWFTGAGGTIFGAAWFRSPGDVKGGAS